DDGVRVQVRGLKVFMCSGEKLTQFFSSTTGIVEERGYYERYSEFLAALETCCDLSTSCLQAQVQSHKFLECVRSRQGIMQDPHPTSQDVHTQEGAPVTVKRSRSGKSLPEPMDPKVLQDLRSSNLLAATFGGEHFPGDQHILWTMRTLVDVASSGRVSCAPPTGSAHHGGTLHTDVARVSDDVMWVMHSACSITPDLMVITTEMQYKVVRKKSSDGRQEAFEICDACFSFASGDSPSKKDVTLQIPKSVPISRSKWDVFKDMLKPPVAPESFLDKMCRWLTTAWDSLKSFVSRAGEYMIRLFRACCPCVRPQHVSEDDVTRLDSNRDSHECESAVSEVSAPAPVIGTSSEHVHSNDADVEQGSEKAESVTDVKKPSNIPPKKPPRAARSVQSSSAHSVAGVPQGSASGIPSDLCTAASCPDVSGAREVAREVGGPSTSVAEPTAASSVLQLQSSRARNVSSQKQR
ncbi:hypothetical protein, partial [Anaplasma phagocytophilum]|uniref:hypothetical protein n=1 Tax=Anaplasma phagocytophilum TaxID=948 RepID=UPI000ABF7C93